MKKIFLFLIIVIVVPIAMLFLSIFLFPNFIVSNILPVIFEYKYNITMDFGGLNEVPGKGIVITDLELKNDYMAYKCEKIETDIKYDDILSLKRKGLYQVYLKNPRVIFNDIESCLNITPVGFPLFSNLRIVVSGGKLLVMEEENDLHMDFHGEIGLSRKALKIENWVLDTEDFRMSLSGDIDKNQELHLKANYNNSDNMFLIKGTLKQPEIETKWNGLDTVFKVGNIYYKDREMVLDKIDGNISIKGFPDVNLRGEIGLGKDYVKLKDLVIFKSIKVKGIMAKDKTVKLRIVMDNISGSEIADELPKSLQFLFSQHHVSGDISVFGMINHIEAGGILKLMSDPVEIACRYRDNKFLFSSLSNNDFDFSGSISWITSEPYIKIKGLIKDMEIGKLYKIISQGKDFKGRGTVDGSFKIEGEIGDPFVTAKLEINNYEYNAIKFDVAYINLEGDYAGPLNLEHSMIYYKDVPGMLTGYISRESDNVFKNVKVVPVGDKIIWEGLNITKDEKGKLIKLDKDVNEKISVSFRSALNSDPGGADMDDEPEMKLKYKILDDKNLLLKVHEEDGTVGVEHTVEF